MMKRKKYRILVVLLALCITFASCASVQPFTEPTQSAEEVVSADTAAPTAESMETEPTEPSTAEDPAEKRAGELLAGMSTYEKFCQLLFVTPESLSGAETATIAGDMTREGLEKYPVGGIIYFGKNVVSAEQITAMIAATQEMTKIPLFFGVDEEGGRVSRLSGVGLTQKLSPMADYGAAGDRQAVYDIHLQLGSDIRTAGFNVDFAPVADVVTNPDNTVIGDRAFSSSASIASVMVASAVHGLEDGGVISCLKHFPGHGSTSADSHLGMSVTNRTLEQLTDEEWLPFKAGIEAGAGMVMVAHISAPEITGDNTPCDLSPRIVNELLRGQLGFDGVVITDAQNMGAITDYYSVGEAAVLAIEAGCDIVLMPGDLQEALDALQEAADSGRLSMQRIDESVLRILRLKIKYGII
ncbi:MAG: glycoside hydrolase family 3 protein [Oscillospiraceae bacterium]|jgi:beta-N-acetylhexosaminidase|nr:glycoside hydrolase family 3 protein [Oscillospiraceae bacterium]